MQKPTISRIKPPPLISGSRIGVVCPADSADVISPEMWQAALERLKSKDFEVVEGRYTRSRYGHTAGRVSERVEDLMRMFEDRSIRAILAGLGGFNSNQLLPFLDYQLIRSQPKIFMGFSDITALSLAIHAKAGLVTFIGPVFSTFCQPELPRYTEECFDALVVEGRERFVVKASEHWAEDAWYLKEGFRTREWRENPGWLIHRPGVAEGLALGGEISTLMTLAGTDFMPSFDGSILFVEGDETQTPAEFDRHLTHLRQMGVFEKIGALIVGRSPSAAGFTEQDSLSMILEEAARGYDFPIVSGLDFSHTDPLLTIPIGIRCRLDTSRPELVFVESAVSASD